MQHSIDFSSCDAPYMIVEKTSASRRFMKQQYLSGVSQSKIMQHSIDFSSGDAPYTIVRTCLVRQPRII
ncbi:hypothetical protein QUA40_12075 [Microcoleus sp. Pol11C3]|uniref:hypothetical protein n=1 Tax=Microcoleus sp. Pol11C3 TaxID=3055390 RepID=UPI002FD74F96